MEIFSAAPAAFGFSLLPWCLRRGHRYSVEDSLAPSGVKACAYWAGGRPEMPRPEIPVQSANCASNGTARQFRSAGERLHAVGHRFPTRVDRFGFPGDWNAVSSDWNEAPAAVAAPDPIRRCREASPAVRAGRERCRDRKDVR